MKTLEIWFNDNICNRYEMKRVKIDCGTCLALSFARGLFHDNPYAYKIFVFDEEDVCVGVVER